jgi:hypothetical protein
MDKNKLTELRAINYRIPKTCGLCKHGVFVGVNEWGGCAIRQYDHLKHTGPPRQLSIYKGGSCEDKFVLDERRADAIGAYREFIPS